MAGTQKAQQSSTAVEAWLYVGHVLETCTFHMGASCGPLYLLLFHVMVSLDCQLDRTWSHLESATLGVIVVLI